MRVLITGGAGFIGPFREDAEPGARQTRQHRWAYACSKAMDEFLALAYWKERKLPAIVMRLFNTVGPRQTGRYGMVIPTFVRQALADRPITVFWDGSQSRSFAYAGDVVKGMIALASEPKPIGEVFNIGNGHEITIRALAERVKKLTGSRSEIVTIPYDQAYEAGSEDMPRRVPDINKIRALVGYEPRVQLDEILASVIDDFERRQCPNSFWSTVIVGLLFARMSDMVCRAIGRPPRKALTKPSVSHFGPIVGVVKSLPTADKKLLIVANSVRSSVFFGQETQR